MTRILLPHEWKARAYQHAFWRAFVSPTGPRRHVAIWPRRAGKDRTALAGTSVWAMRRPATYWHMLPTNVQAKRVVWNAVDRSNGKKLLDSVFPPPLVRQRNESEMSLELVNGSRWYAVGSDNYDRLVGSDPFGVVFSEYSLADPSAWNYIRPILAENGGWACFLYTPRGRNHGYSLYNMASGNPNWFCELLTTDTTRHITENDIEEERKAGMPEDLLQQEFFCSFSAGAAGAYYGKELDKAREEGRIGYVPYDPNYPVELWFDLGYNDATAIWAVQPCGGSMRAIRYQEFRGMGIPAIAPVVRGWNYRLELLRLPHDGKAHDQTSGRTRVETWEDELRCPAELSPRPRNGNEVMEQIAATRSLLPLMLIDASLCEQGLFALESYCREYDDRLQRYKDRPRHDWASHGADSFRTGAIKHAGGIVGSASAERIARVRKPLVLRAGRKVVRPEEPIDWSHV